MRILQCLVAVILYALSIPPQQPADISLTLATKDGRTQFRLGEAVTLELQFQSTAAGKYQLWTDSAARRVRQARYDHFTVQPNDGTADPLADIFEQMEGGVLRRLPTPVPLTEKPAAVELQLNEWISIRKPGHYRIAADSTRAVLSERPETTVPLHSNSIEIDVVEPEPGWAAAQLRDAVAVLERGDPPKPAAGQPFDPRHGQVLDEEIVQAARVLRFLETPEAARALVRFFENGPQAAQPQLRAGLFASPHRKEVTAAMETALASPDFPVTYAYLGTLMGFKAIEQIGPMPAYTAKTPEEIKHWIEEVEAPRRPAQEVIEDEYFSKLAEALKTKRGRALAVSLDTLVSRGPQPPSAALVTALGDSFTVLPEMTQQRLLTEDWPKLASLSMVPFLKSVATGNTQGRDAALLRLLDLDQQEARRIALDRIRRGDTGRGPFGSFCRSLVMLPDRTLPELDDDLLNALEAGRPVEVLIARYATDRMLPRVKSLMAHTGCNSPLLAYLFRTDPAYAADQLHKMRQDGQGGCALNLSPNEYVLMSPGLEKQAIEDLSSTDPFTVRSAQTLLMHGGSAAAQQPLLEAMIRFRERIGKTDNLLDHGMESGFEYALLHGSGWVPSEEDIERVLAACSTDDCRKQVDSVRRSFPSPLSVSFVPTLNDLEYAQVGPFSVQTPGQLEAKIAQFPKGTKFYLAPYYEGTWYQDEHKRLLQQMLTAAGMQLVEAPPRDR